MFTRKTAPRGQYRRIIVHPENVADIERFRVANRNMVRDLADAREE